MGRDTVVVDRKVWSTQTQVCSASSLLLRGGHACPVPSVALRRRMILPKSLHLTCFFLQVWGKEGGAIENNQFMFESRSSE